MGYYGQPLLDKMREVWFTVQGVNGAGGHYRMLHLSEADKQEFYRQMEAVHNIASSARGGFPTFMGWPVVFNSFVPPGEVQVTEAPVVAS